MQKHGIWGICKGGEGSDRPYYAFFFCRYYCAAEISWHYKPDEKPFFVVFGRENCNCCIYQAVAIYCTTAVTGNMQRCFL